MLYNMVSARLMFRIEPATAAGMGINEDKIPSQKPYASQAAKAALRAEESVKQKLPPCCMCKSMHSSIYMHAQAHTGDQDSAKGRRKPETETASTLHVYAFKHTRTHRHVRSHTQHMCFSEQGGQQAPG